MLLRNQYVKVIKILLSNNLTNKIFKNSSWLVIEKIINMFIGVFVTAIIARYFGPELFGQFNYAFALVTLFTAFSTLGLETLTVKTIVDKEYDEGRILCTSLFLRVFGGIILTIIAAIVIKIIEPNERNLHLLVLIMSFTMVVKSFEVIEYWIQAYQKSKISSLIRIYVYILTALLKIIVVIFSGNLFHLSLIYVIDGAVTGLALIIAYFKIRHDAAKWKLDMGYAKNILSKSWYLILSGLMITLYMRIDQVMLGAMMQDKAENGVFSAAVRIAEMWYFVPLAIITSFKPVILNTKKVDEVSYLRSIQLLYNIVTWLSIGFGVLVVLISKPVIKVLYGAEFSDAASILSISIWAGTFAMLGTARSIWLISEGLQRYTMVYTFGGLVVNIVLNYILIPHFGAHGAAIATLAAQITANVIMLSFFKNTRVSTVMILRSFISLPIIRKSKLLGNSTKL
ncbi:flippase [Paenibacillus sp. DLE-14]|uniref:Flippase n=2 Tax=Paenibacillus lignilyticus TaxID=1172615 RepID=A0ABS5CG28_9BACL|nr:flippase [Paenibacillus lignilyticus]